MSIDANDILFGSSSPSAKFASIGDAHTGQIVDLGASQQTDFTTGAPKHWPNGDPMMQVIVTLATDERDSEDPSDDGQRRIFVRGKSLTDAVRNAVRAAGAKKLEVGGTLTVSYVGDGPKERGKNPAKLYSASYAKPEPKAAVAANDALGLGDTPAAVPSVQQLMAGGGDVDLSNLPADARALVERMYAQQQGATA